MPKNFIERIKKLSSLTPSETRIADFFSRNYDELVFENLTSISKKANVSKPTVLRFLSKLGFRKFSHFNGELKREIKKNQDSMYIRYSLKKKLSKSTGEDIIAETFKNTMQNLDNTYNSIDVDEFNLIARMIVECKGKIYITGQRSSYALSYIFHNMVRKILGNAVLIEPQSSIIPDYLIDVSSEDMVFAIYRRPYSSDTKKIVEYFNGVGAEKILITDNDLNPLSSVATRQISVNTEGVSVYTSSTSVLAILEALNMAVVNNCDESVSERIEKAERIYKKFGIFNP